ncbi:hypothetical protein JCM8547_005472 [Rhodosporidiobolus lusitaniae]
MATDDSPFARTVPAVPSPAALLQLHLAGSPLRTRLSQLVDGLYASRVGKEIKRQIDQLQGELRDDWRTRSRAVKADYLARVVPVQEEDHYEQQEEDERIEKELARTTLDDSNGLDEASSAPPLVPTILSDADDTAAMSSRVDEQVEASIRVQVDEAEKLVSESVRKTVGLELELWLGQTILDSFEQAAGDEDEAARLVEAALEDKTLDEGLSLPSSATSSG